MKKIPMFPTVMMFSMALNASVARDAHPFEFDPIVCKFAARSLFGLTIRPLSPESAPSPSEDAVSVHFWGPRQSLDRDAVMETKVRNTRAGMIIHYNIVGEDFRIHLTSDELSFDGTYTDASQGESESLHCDGREE